MSGGPYVEWQRPEPPPLLRPGAELGQATIPADVVRETITRAVDEIRLCYECAWTRSSQPGSTFVSRFAIGPDGTVAALEVVENDFDRTTTECMSSVMEALRFPALDGDGYVIVVYPFRFSTAPPP